MIGKDVRVELTRMRHGLLYPPVHDHLPQSCHAQAEQRRRAVRKGTIGCADSACWRAQLQSSATVVAVHGSERRRGGRGKW